MREKLIELLGDCKWWGELEDMADYLIENGVVVTDINDGCIGCLYANRRRPQKCSCCSRNKYMKDGYTPEGKEGKA